MFHWPVLPVFFIQMNLGCLCGGLGSHQLHFSKQMYCTIWDENERLKKAEAWARVERMIAWRAGSCGRQADLSSPCTTHTDLVFWLGWRKPEPREIACRKQTLQPSPSATAAMCVWNADLLFSASYLLSWFAAYVLKGGVLVFCHLWYRRTSSVLVVL